MSSEPQSTPPTVERFHPRVAANLMVRVHINGREVLARARDLSMNGLFLLAHPSARTERLTLTLPLPDGEVQAPCRVRRQEHDGVALEFDTLDWDDLIVLARFLHPRMP